MIPYETSRDSINSYLHNRAKPIKINKETDDNFNISEYQFPTSNRLIRSNEFKPYFEPTFHENNTKTVSKWTLNTARRNIKRELLFPTILHIELKAVNENSKLKIDVFEKGIFFEDRKKDKQKEWINILINEIEARNKKLKIHNKSLE